MRVSCHGIARSPGRVRSPGREYQRCMTHKSRGHDATVRKMVSEPRQISCVSARCAIVGDPRCKSAADAGALRPQNCAYRRLNAGYLPQEARVLETLLFERRKRELPSVQRAPHSSCFTHRLWNPNEAPASIRLTRGVLGTRATCVTSNLERRAGFGLQTGFPRRKETRKVFNSLDSHSRGRRQLLPLAQYSSRGWNSLSHRLAVF